MERIHQEMKNECTKIGFKELFLCIIKHLHCSDYLQRKYINIYMQSVGIIESDAFRLFFAYKHNAYILLA